MSREMQWKERQEDKSQMNQWHVTGRNTVHASFCFLAFPSCLSRCLDSDPSIKYPRLGGSRREMQLSVNPVHGRSQKSFNHGLFLLTGQEKKWRTFTMHVFQKPTGIVSVKVRRLQLANPNLVAHTVSLVDPKFYVYVNGPQNYRNSASMLIPQRARNHEERPTILPYQIDEGPFSI